MSQYIVRCICSVYVSQRMQHPPTISGSVWFTGTTAHCSHGRHIRRPNQGAHHEWSRSAISLQGHHPGPPSCGGDRQRCCRFSGGGGRGRYWRAGRSWLDSGPRGVGGGTRWPGCIFRSGKSWCRHAQHLQPESTRRRVQSYRELSRWGSSTDSFAIVAGIRQDGI